MTDLPAEMPVSPNDRVAQTNRQTLHLHIHHGMVDLSGRILGVALRQDGLPLPRCEVHLFFGPIGEHPVATTRTDEGGSFLFEDLPPGFYGVRLIWAEGPPIHLYNLRVRPGVTSEPRLLVSGGSHPDPSLQASRHSKPGETARPLRTKGPR